MKVIKATTGARLLPGSAGKTLCDELLPLSYILTPNIPEANILLQAAGQESIDVHGLSGLKRLAAAVLKLGPKYVLVKGGHMPLDEEYMVAERDDRKKIVVNVLVGDDVEEVFESEYQNSRNTHGTGCSLACMFFFPSPAGVSEMLMRI